LIDVAHHRRRLAAPGGVAASLAFHGGGCQQTALPWPARLCVRHRPFASPL